MSIALPLAILLQSTAAPLAVQAATSRTERRGHPPQPDAGSMTTADPISAGRSGEIIVTARRRSETAQAVPLAISVIRSDSIEATGNFNVVKLQQLAPTLQVYVDQPAQHRRSTSAGSACRSA